MTVIRLPEQRLFLHAPVRLSPALEQRLTELGTVKWIVAPSKLHPRFIRDYTLVYPRAMLYGAPGLAAIQKNLKFDRMLDQTAAHEWDDAIRFHLFQGVPRTNEVVFFHPASRTLILTELVFNVTAVGRNKARLFHRLIGATGRFGPHRLMRMRIRDREAARTSVETLLNWDFDRVIMSHGEVLESGGKAALKQAFAYLFR